MAKAKKKPKKLVVAKDKRTMLRALTVDGYSTWLENLFAYDSVAIDFPETADVVKQLEKLTQVSIDHGSVTCSKDVCRVIDRLLYEHRVLMEIRYARYFKPVVTAITLGLPGIMCPPEIFVLGPNYESESYRKANRNRDQPLGPFVANGTELSIERRLRRSFSEQLVLASESCAVRNFILAARQAGSFEQLINQTVEKYLGYKFGAPHADH